MSASGAVPMYDDVATFLLACGTPLPSNSTETSTSAVERSTTNCSTGQAIPPSSEIPSPPSSFPVRQKLKRRAPIAGIEISVDPETAAPPPKKSATTRKDGRTVLGERKDFANACPRTLDTSSSFIPSIDDWNRFAHHFTPPPTPQPSPKTQISRINRSTKPACMILYSFLEMHDWKASEEEIKAAYKRVAIQYHPDKVVEEAKEVAHDNMLCINAARDVLLDKMARTKYHKDGKLPTVFLHVFPQLFPRV